MLKGNFTPSFMDPVEPAPTNDARAFKMYFERLESARLGNIKHPDLLIFKTKYKAFVDQLLADVGGVEELPFIIENELQKLIQKATIAV